MAKLCALVSMQRISGPTVQSFSLPMTLVDKEIQVFVVLCALCTHSVYMLNIHSMHVCMGVTIYGTLIIRGNL